MACFGLPGLFMGNAALSLFGGILFVLTRSTPENFFSKKIGSKLLQVAIVILGGTINLNIAIEYGQDYSLIISSFVIFVFLLALFIGKILRVSSRESYLLAVGSAICGATAVATIAPLINAKPKEISTVIGLIFILNLIAIFSFPYFGKIMNLSQVDFGFWSALAIHDTSSVLGAASLYGDEAMKAAATIKIIKTLWLVPLVLITSYIYKGERNFLGIPVFALLFLLAVFINYIFSFPLFLVDILSNISRTLLLIGLFCIGTQLDKESLSHLSSSAVFQGSLLWILVVPIALLIVLFY